MAELDPTKAAAVIAQPPLDDSARNFPKFKITLNFFFSFRAPKFSSPHIFAIGKQTHREQIAMASSSASVNLFSPLSIEYGREQEQAGTFLLNVDRTFQMIHRLYDEDKLARADQLVEATRASVSALISALRGQEGEGKEEEDLVGKLEAVLERLQADARVSALALEMTEIRRVRSAMEDNDGWVLVKEAGTYQTFYRNEDGNPIHSIKIKGVLNVPLFNLAAVINEIDLYVDWVPFLKESRETVELSKYRRGVYSLFALPWPLSNRDMVVYGYGVDMLAEQSQLMIVIRSIGAGYGGDGEGLAGGIHAERLVAASPAEDASAVRMDFKIAGFLLSPVTATSTHLTVLSNVDPRMSIVPYFLLNFVTKQLAGILIGKLESLAAGIESDPRSKYLERIANKPHIYQDIRERVAALSNGD